MALTGDRTFVGFGFGAIQAGLFLYEAFRSGGFARLVVGEVLPDAVDAVRRNAGFYALNIAHTDCVEAAWVGPVQIENPAPPGCGASDRRGGRGARNLHRCPQRPILRPGGTREHPSYPGAGLEKESYHRRAARRSVCC